MSEPSCVLVVKTHGMPQRDLQRQLGPLTRNQDLPMYTQKKLAITFVQLPSIAVAARCMDFLNSGTVVTSSGRQVSAEFSDRKEVTTGVSNNTSSLKRNGPNAYETGSPGNKRQRADREYGRPVQQEYFGNGGNRGNNTINAPVDDTPPSPVLCLKSDLTEREMIELLQSLSTQHGVPSPVDILYIQGRKMAFVQYQGIRQSTRAKRLLNDQNEIAEFSKRQTIQRDSKSRKPQSEEDIQQNGPRKPESPDSKVVLVTLRPIRQIAANDKVMVDQLLVPCSRFGVVHKIITFRKKDSNEVQALVQYESLEFAQLARERLDNSVLDNFRLMVRFSDREELSVEKNDDRTRDYTNPLLGEEVVTYSLPFPTGRD